MNLGDKVNLEFAHEAHGEIVAKHVTMGPNKGDPDVTTYDVLIDYIFNPLAPPEFLLLKELPYRVIAPLD